ncbi:hypothetical protein ZIOFF_043205 [Zingiber officinale]|uniref:Deoxyuridine 5'-triphosphate nucleotidohydrolase n=1 Tax=Zingiber officinale TaxID=94328 RepID=A0A8J5KTV7_ZINOF|nr:hypothetical protein ZIOFF_043205 [Zingiber officinale]
MKNKTSGAAGFDLAANQSIIIEPRGRALVPTELSLEIPWGTYGRIAARSSIAWNLGLDIGAEVIDSDYRGEIFVLLFNHSDERVFLPQVVEESKPNLDVQLPKEKHALSTFLEEEALPPKEASKNLAGTTSPWASVPRSKDPFDDIPEGDSDFSYIQYLAQLSQPKDAQLSPPKDII